MFENNSFIMEVKQRIAWVCEIIISSSKRTKWTMYSWIIIALQMFIIIGLLTKPEQNRNIYESGNKDWFRYEPQVQEDLSSVIIPSHQHRVFYNRVPKCGSSTIMELISHMTHYNNFTFGRSRIYMTFYMDQQFQANFVKQLIEKPSPIVFERHLHFLHFMRYGVEQPSYINLIRDPLDRLVSWYYFRRYQSGHVRNMPNNKRIRSYDACVLGNYSECVDPLGNESEEGYFKIIPFFCGQQDYCRKPGEKSLIQAIHNVKKYYAVVGVVEQYLEFIEALEYILPTFFKGASLVYRQLDESLSNRYKTTYKLPVSSEVRDIMYPKLNEEYQFYNFIRHRFEKISKSIRAAKEKFYTKHLKS